jgi:hypothetical protein
MGPEMVISMDVSPADTTAHPTPTTTLGQVNCQSWIWPSAFVNLMSESFTSFGP